MSSVPDPELWYLDGYGPIWIKASEQTAERATAFYADEIVEHAADGELRRELASKWLGESVADWLEEGWLGSELPNVLTNRINASTASFKARYLDFYEGGERSHSCAWYLAHHGEDGWKFTAYAEIDCDSVDW